MNYLQILDKDNNIIDNIMVDDSFFDKKQIFENAQIVHCPPIGTMYEFIYNTDFAKYISEKLKEYINQRNPNIGDNFVLKIISKEEYKQYDENFANECNFLDYINSHNANIDKMSYITKEILLSNGFEINEKETELCKQFQEEQYGIEDYISFKLWTKDKYPIKLDIDNGWTNSGRKWSVHIDNDACETIGYADIDTIWQFNMLMGVFESKFRLKI